MLNNNCVLIKTSFYCGKFISKYFLCYDKFCFPTVAYFGNKADNENLDYEYPPR